MHDAHQPTMTTSSVSPSGFSLYLFGCTLIAALGGLLFGFDTAVISGTTDALRSVYGLSDNLLGFTVASALIGTIMGSLGAGWPADALGRRGTLAWLGVLYFVSAVGCAFAWDWWSFLFFRWLGGLAVGGASVVSPLYTRRFRRPGIGDGWWPSPSSMSFPMIAAAAGWMAFGFYALCMVGQIAWVLTIMPETKGISLERIQEELGIE